MLVADLTRARQPDYGLLQECAPRYFI